MKYCVGTPNRGWYLKSDTELDGKDKSFKFMIIGESHSDYSKCPVSRRSLSGFANFLEGAPLTAKITM